MKLKTIQYDQNEHLTDDFVIFSYELRENKVQFDGDYEIIMRKPLRFPFSESSEDSHSR